MASTPDVPPTEPWERQGGESARQHARFTTYLSIGPYRTLAGTHKALTESGDRIAYTSLRQISSEHRWAPRADAWDAQQAREDAVSLAMARREMIVRHMSIADALMTRATAALADTGDISPADVVRMIKLAADLQWRALGQPTVAVEISGRDGGPVQTEDISHLTGDARRARIRELAVEMARRSGLATYPIGDDD